MQCNFLYVSTSKRGVFSYEGRTSPSKLIDFAREGAFYLRVPFSYLPLVTVSETITATLSPIFHICVFFTLLLILIPSNFQLNYCGYRRYIVRDVSPRFDVFLWNLGSL